jgi:DNA polymerase-2
MYVDGLWVKKPGAAQVADFQPLLDEILDRTGLPVGLEGVYRWISFLPSRVDARVPVANRYFGVFQDGSRKVRGIELRRLDTPAFIYELQDNMLSLLAEVPQAALLRQQLPEIYALLRHTLVRLRAGRISLEKLLVSQKLSRTLDEYRIPSPAARAAAQLAALGTELRPGQRVRFIFTLGEPGVYAWNLPTPPNPAAVDISRYTTLMIRAASTILQPLGVSETALRERLLGNVIAKPRFQFPDHIAQNRYSIISRA